MSLEKARDLVQQGDKKLKKFSLFGSDDKYENAEELYQQAATQFKACGAWLEAADCYMRCADCAKKLKMEMDIADCYINAGSCYTKAGDTNRGMQLVMEAVDSLERNGKIQQCAKLCAQLGDQLMGGSASSNRGGGGEEDDDDSPSSPGVDRKTQEQAIEWYNRAIGYYRRENSNATANDLVGKIAEAHARMENYPQAVKMYDKLARDALDDRLLRSTARRHFFMALLCQMAMITKTNLMEGVEALKERFDEACMLDTQLTEHTREHMLVQAVVEAFEEDDMDKFTDAVTDHDTVSPLDDLKMRMLLRAKAALRHTDLR